MKAMVLGGVAPHIELLNLLKGKGYETILVDYLEEPPAKDYADIFIRESTLDKEKVLELAKQYQIDLIMTICVDHANVTMCDVAEKLQLPVPYSLEVAMNTTDKSRMKKVMKENGVPTSDYYVIKKQDCIPEDIHYPVVVKPVDCNGSKGIRKADNYDELIQALPEAFSFTRKGEVIIEGFNDGFEIQVDCFANHGEANVLMIREKLPMPRGNSIALQSRGSLTPARISEDCKNEIYKIADKIAKGFKLEHTPFFFQAITDGNKVMVLELSPRIGGGLSYKLLKKQTDFDVIEAIYQSYFGNLDQISICAKDQYLLTTILYGINGKFDHITGIEELIKNGTIDDFDLMAEKGREFGNVLDSRNRIGAYFISDSSYNSLLNKAQTAKQEIQVLDSDGQSVLFPIQADL